MKPQKFSLASYRLQYYDPWIIFSVLGLMALGILMVSSASLVISEQQHGYAWYYVIRQAIYLFVGLSACVVVTTISLNFLYKTSRLQLLVALLLLLIVLVPGIGRMVNGSRRWLDFGILSLQVSEIAKLFLIVYLAAYLEDYRQQVKTQLIGFVKPMVILALAGLLLLMEPDFGTLAVLALTFLALLLIAEVPLWPFALLLVLVIVAMSGLALLSPYRLQRLTTFLNPWLTPYGSGYQLTQSLIAFGRGGIFGTGLGNSVQKLFYLPEAHTDFLFAVLAEELGLLGECVVLALFATLVGRSFYLAKMCLQQQAWFRAYLAAGLGLWMGLQALINMGVNSGLLPTKGLTLPFISYGGSSMLINCVVIGILLRLSHETHYCFAPKARSASIPRRRIT